MKQIGSFQIVWSNQIVSKCLRNIGNIQLSVHTGHQKREEIGVGSRTSHATVYANVGVHADVEITVAVDRHCGAAIHFGHEGPDLIMDFADVDSLERLATVAADGARQLRARIAAHPLGSTNRC
jgi:hypothetical protein